MNRHKNLLAALAMTSLGAFAQHGYWQNHVDYTMDIVMDVEKHQFAGDQQLVFTNNSPDTLREAFYHLYFNAFQPESMLDVRSRNLSDPDGRIRDRVQKLRQDEVGYHQVYFLEQDGQKVEYEVNGTVLHVKFQRAIAPGDATMLHMKFNSQVPVQIRRSGRDNREDVEFSMAQWYPKLAVYDEDGWHPDPYIAREFYGDFGRFVVNITIDSDYMIGGTGVLLNPEAIGKGYSDANPRLSNQVTWKFAAENVHDFAWAADPDFVHEKVEVPNGPTVHFFYQPEEANEENWEKLQDVMESYFTFMSERFGTYAYPQFSVVQAGDGGMEYPMCTFVLGGGEDWKGFLGLFVHEATHNWYYGMLGTNEQAYPWMDEGFTTFAEDEFMGMMFNEELPHFRSYMIYRSFQSSPLREPMSTPADHFNTNRAYALSSYYMGSVFLHQLRYIVGEEAFWNGMMKYYDVWHFKHPKPEDFLRIMEEESGMVLDWYLTYWVDLTKPIDYKIAQVDPMGMGATHIRLERVGTMPMPVDVTVVMNSGEEVTYTIPLGIMQGVKPGPLPATPWAWTNPTYDLQVDFSLNDIERIVIDSQHMMADMDETNNIWPPIEVDEATEDVEGKRK